MSESLLWPLVRLGIGLLLGFLVARRLRGFIRWAATRSFPIGKRMAEDFYTRLTRLTTTIGFVLAFALAAAVYFGSGYLWQFVTRESHTQLREAEPRPVVYELPPPARDTVSPPPAEIVPSGSFPESPPPPESVRQQPPPIREVAYLQLGAYEEPAFARHDRLKWGGFRGKSARLAYLPSEKTPYKLLLGPFASLRAARRFRDRYVLQGFPREVAAESILQE